MFLINFYNFFFTLHVIQSLRDKVGKTTEILQNYVYLQIETQQEF